MGSNGAVLEEQKSIAAFNALGKFLNVSVDGDGRQRELRVERDQEKWEGGRERVSWFVR